MRARYSERTRKKRRDKKRLPGLRPTLTDQRIALGIAAPGYKRDARCTTGSYFWLSRLVGSQYSRIKRLDQRPWSQTF